MTIAIEINNLSKTFGRVKALDNISIKINEGEIVALIGPSGSGKSTLLRHIAGLEVSDNNLSKRDSSKSDAKVSIFDKAIQQNGVISKSARQTRIGIGVIFQQFNLINRLSVLTNVLLGALGTIPRWRGTLGLFSRKEKIRAIKALDSVGLKSLAFQRASTLSGGQQQRVAIASTLMQGARLVLADEPIASLDPSAAKSVMKNLRQMRKDYGKTVVVTLHQVDYARKYCQRVIALVDGKVAFDGAVSELNDELLNELYGTSFQVSDDDDDHELQADHGKTKSNDFDFSYDFGLGKTA